MNLTAWETVSTYENPGNLSPERLAILKDFWATLLALFDAKTSLATEWPKHFSPTEKDPDTQQFQEMLRELDGPAVRDEFYKLLRHDYVDLLPLRFLKARSYEKIRAMRMLLNALSFRRKNIPKAMRSEANNDPEFIAALKKGKSYVPCYDNQGRTITYIRIANHARGDCSQDVFERYTLYAMEHAHLLHLPFQDRTVLLADMSNFSITSLDLNAIKFIIQNFEQYYPEELSEGIIHNAPWLFGTAWAIIKPLLRAQTREKITFTSNINELAAKIGRAEAEKVMSVKMQYIPDPSPEIPFKDEARDLTTASAECHSAFDEWNTNIEDLETLTREWARPTASDTPLADITALDEKRTAAAWKLSRSYWRIDEFVRPKSYYDRAGQLPPSPTSTLNVAQMTRPSSQQRQSLSRSSSKPVSLKSQKSSKSLSKLRMEK